MILFIILSLSVLSTDKASDMYFEVQDLNLCRVVEYSRFSLTSIDPLAKRQNINYSTI
jgi:hypothetical protein